MSDIGEIAYWYRGAAAELRGDAWVDDRDGASLRSMEGSEAGPITPLASFLLRTSVEDARSCREKASDHLVVQSRFMGESACRRRNAGGDDEHRHRVTVAGVGQRRCAIPAKPKGSHRTMHHTPLIATIVAGLVVAFIFGAIAHRLRVPPIAGYLLAGVMVGPFTPGFVADAGLAAELAEIGVILLMFGVGLHFSLRDLLSVWTIAVPGAIVQIAAATVMGAALGHLLGWPLFGGIVFGLALSVASTVVLLRALQSRDLVDTERGRIAVGWLIVEDLVMVLALVLLPAIATALDSGGSGGGIGAVATSLGITLLKVGGFVALMLVAGPRIIPALLHWVAHTGSRELFRLAVLAIALGVAFGAALIFGVSLALGAFFAGMILGETPLSRRAAEETLPLRDAFAVLFFVSVGMLFNPSVVVEQPLALLATVAIIVIGKSLAAFAIVRLFRHPTGTALTIAVSLAQIGEFSFILAALGGELGVLPQDGRDLILAGALISIFLNSFLFSAVAALKARGHVAEGSAAAEAEAAKDGLILVGYGRVGRFVAQSLAERGIRPLLIEVEDDRARRGEGDGLEAIVGNAVEERVLAAAGIASARRLVIAIPEGFEAGAIAEHARALNPSVEIIARAHSEAQAAHLAARGVAHVISGEREIARRMSDLAT
ncbi:MAG: putative potassium-efflux system protein [Sphingomonas bacterium]|nr:putative potassium-efflux system protein [Sphingomonas bacterium]